MYAKKLSVHASYLYKNVSVYVHSIARYICLTMWQYVMCDHPYLVN